MADNEMMQNITGQMKPEETLIDQRLRKELEALHLDADDYFDTFPTQAQRLKELENIITLRAVADTEKDYIASAAEPGYASLREQMATALDLILAVRDAAAEGKTSYTSDEVIQFLYGFVQSRIKAQS